MSKKKKDKTSKTLLIVGGAIAAAILAKKVFGKGSDSDSADFGVGVGSAGGQDAYGNDSPGGQQYSEDYDYPEYPDYPVQPLTLQAPPSAMPTSGVPQDNSGRLGYVNPFTGENVSLSQTDKFATDRFGFDPSTGAFVDRFRQQSIDPSQLSAVERGGYSLMTGNAMGDFDLALISAGGQPTSSMFDMQGNLKTSEPLPVSSAFDVPGAVDTSAPQTMDESMRVKDALMFSGAALGGNLALQKGAETLQSNLNAKYPGMPKTAPGSVAGMISDPYGVSTAKTSKKGIQEVAGAAAKTAPKWARVLSKGANFIPLLDVPIGAALDKKFMKGTDFEPSWKQAFAANMAGEAAQLGVGAAGAAVGGVGAIPAFLVGTGADIAATEATYARFRKSSAAQQSSRPKQAASQTVRSRVSSSRSPTRTGATSRVSGSSGRRSSSSSSRRSSSSSSSRSSSSSSSRRSSSSSSRSSSSSSSKKVSRQSKRVTRKATRKAKRATRKAKRKSRRSARKSRRSARKSRRSARKSRRRSRRR
jgi:hypothetical protein